MTANALDIEEAIATISDGVTSRARVIEAMEACEHWILDTPGGSVDARMLQLGEVIGAGQFDAGMAQINDQEWIELLALIRSGRFYRLFQEIMRTDQATGYALGRALADESACTDGEHNVLRLRLLIANQLGYLADLFDPQRVQTVELAIEDMYAND